MKDQDYLKDIQDIKTLMNRSTQFLSLSGMAGILAGVYALIGSFIAYNLMTVHRGYYITLESSTFRYIVIIAAAVLLLSLATAIFFTIVKARKNGETVWNSTSRRLLINFLIPLVTGGIFALLLLRNQHYGLIASVTLIFYGLACVNASKFTVRDVRYLGITIIVLGLLASTFPGYALLFWALGFGVCHIIYGAIMYYKYDRK